MLGALRQPGPHSTLGQAAPLPCAVASTA
jgi:hypothetical protein